MEDPVKPAFVPPPVEEVPEAALPPDEKTVARAALAAAAELADQGKLEEAAAAYREIVAKDPRAWEAYMALGELSLEMGAFEEATKYFRLAESFLTRGE